MNVGLLKVVSARFILLVSVAILVFAGVSTVLLPNKVEALAPGATELRLSSAAPGPVEAGTGTATFSVKEVRGLLFGGWTDVLASYPNATITASVTVGEISTNCSTWNNTATRSISIGKAVQGSFCYRGNTTGTHNINLTATIPRILSSPIVNSLVVPVTVQDTVAPAVPVVSTPTDNAVLKSSDLMKVDWNDVTDVSSPVAYNYESAHTNLVNSDGSFMAPVYVSAPLLASEIPTLGTPEGIYFYHVQAVDSVGNKSVWSAPRKVTVDDTAPVITHNISVTLLSGTVSITEAVVDENPAVYEICILDEFGVQVQVEGVDLCVSEDPAEGDTLDLVWDTTTVPDGQYIVWFYASDLAGNSSEITQEVTVDNTAPVVTVDAQSVTTKTPVITGTVDDPTAMVAVTVDGTVYTAGVDMTPNAGGTYDWSVPTTAPLAYGTYDVSVVARDNVGNEGMDTTTNELVITQPAVVPSTTVVTPTTVAQLVNFANDTPANNVDDNSEVLANTTATGAVTPEAAQSDEGESKAATDEKKKTENNNFLGLGWWWLLILALIAAMYYYYARRQVDEK